MSRLRRDFDREFRDGDDKGDVVAFCELAEDGVGMRPAEGEVDLAQLDALEDAAPPDIREAATTVANASREIDEIEDLQELFERAFALEEVVATARQEIRTYTQLHCLQPNVLGEGRGHAKSNCSILG